MAEDNSHSGRMLWLRWSKPSRSRFVTHRSAESLPVQVVCDGIVSRTVRDTAHFVAGAEQYWSNKRLPQVGLVEGPSDRRLRIGLLTQSLSGHQPCEQTLQAVNRVANLLGSAGHRVSEFKPPNMESFSEDFANYWGFLAFIAQPTG